MELSEARFSGTQGTGRKLTHDFLSLYCHSTAQQDARPPSEGSYLKTHDFLQPLEKKTNAKEEVTDEISYVGQKSSTPSIEHLLPGGIGTYSISHISHINNNQRVPKPEVSLFTVPQAIKDRNDNSNCSSYTSSGFTLWEKQNNEKEKPILGESAAKLGRWMLTKRTSQSLCDNRHSSSTSVSSSQTTGLKNKSFIETMKSIKNCGDNDEPDEEEASVLKNEYSNTQREHRVEVEGKSTYQKPNSPRSKHSATEQRRRSKINNRFLMLRQLIPHGDQKRDKASFLSEVIEYINFLQEKVHKYEGTFQGWNHDPEKVMPWINDHKPAAESFEPCSTNSGSGPSPTLLFASKVDDINTTVLPKTRGSNQNVESGSSTPATIRAMGKRPGKANKTKQFPISLQPNFFASSVSAGPDGVVSQLKHRLASAAENTMHQTSVQCETSSTEVTAASDDKLKEKDPTVEGGVISMSSVYSKGLLDTLTQALQSSGVDLSQASLSVQIELGMQASIRPTSPICGAKDGDFPSKGRMRSKVSSSEQSDQAVKKPKTCRS